MALGTAGSTLTGELNRLAGITNVVSYKDTQGAANAYAGTSGLGLIAALNYKASTSRQPNNYKGLNAVCNELASTTGKSAVDALRAIDL
jgi:hypothetical protein